MLNKFIILAILVLGMGASLSAHAEEKLMVLWPKQRAAHQAVIDERAVAYKTRGQAYVDHLYDSGGEEPMPAADDFVLGGEIEPVPINVGQVADIVKDSAASAPSPAAQTAATPQ